ncbi:MAG: Na+:solute symporter [Spirochaetia bacterium]|nr:Na+:solute symporter [Spirochaetia bacterium]
MTLDSVDLIVLILYFSVSFGLGLFLGRKGSLNIKEYFLSGKRAPWWLAGTGMVATTFAADTPLAVAGIVARDGVAGNWIWWSSAAGGMLTVFFFARMWNRSGILTDLEFIEIRYGGKQAAFLRGFKSVYFGLLINGIVIGWVNLAMVKILKVLFPEYSTILLLLCILLVTAVYVSFSGLWGVAAADMFQFAVAMTGTIALAFFSVNAVTESTGLNFADSLPSSSLAFFPVFGEGEAAEGIYRIGISSFIAFAAIQWWASWYPGAEPGGGGYIAQRIMSARSEKEGFLAALWFVIAHYCLRPWPWILAGLAAIVLYPDLPANQKEEGYVYLIRDLLPSPFRGLLLAAFVGAYMSTISTQLNWGASYLINDLYKRFIVKENSERHYVTVSRIFTVFILLFSLYLTFYLLESIAGAWKILLQFGAGSGFVLILRWYWWRINAVSEIVSMVVPAAVVLFLESVRSALLYSAGKSESAAGKFFYNIIPDRLMNSELIQFSLEFPNSLYLIVGLTVLSVVVTVYATPPESSRVLNDFYQRIKPQGAGWKKISGQSGPLGRLFAGWISGTGIVYSVLFFTGSLLFGQTIDALKYAAVFIISSAVFYFANINKERN